MSDSDGVRQVLDQFLEALNGGDGETAAKLHSQADDAITIGSDPDEWFQGGEAVHRVFAEMGGGGPGGRGGRGGRASWTRWSALRATSAGTRAAAPSSPRTARRSRSARAA